MLLEGFIGVFFVPRLHGGLFFALIILIIFHLNGRVPIMKISISTLRRVVTG